MSRDPMFPQTVWSMVKDVRRRVTAQERCAPFLPSVTVWVPLAEYSADDAFLLSEATELSTVSSCRTFPATTYMDLQLMATDAYAVGSDSVSWELRAWLEADPSTVMTLASGTGTGTMAWDERIDVGAVLTQAILGRLLVVELQLRLDGGTGSAGGQFSRSPS